MGSLELQHDLVNYLCAAATATITGVVLSMACTTGQRENVRGKKETSKRSQRGKRNKSQRSLRKKKGAAVVIPMKEPPKEPVKEPVKEKSSRSKRSERSGRSKRSKKAPEASKMEKTAVPIPMNEDQKTQPPTSPLPPSTSPLLPPTPDAPSTGPSPTVAPPVLSSPSEKKEEEKPKDLPISNGIVVPEERAPESVMIDALSGGVMPKDMSNRIYGAAGEAAVAEAKKQAALEASFDKEKPKKEEGPG